MREEQLSRNTTRTGQRLKRQSIRQEKKRRRKTNQEIMLVTYFFVFLFVGMIAYLGYFTYEKSDFYVTNEYNSKRQTIYADRYVRGDIESIDGEVLATSKLYEDGKEVREYPYGSLFAQVVGYSTRGNTGIESIASSYLLNSSANPILKALYELRDMKCQADTVVTTLDARLQKAAYEALGDAQGAVVALDPSTGAILAMVSKPDYNPNEINEIWEELVDEENSNSNLVNRATQGLYPPGSTFKVLVALEYIRENPDSYLDFSYSCDSVYEHGDYTIRCSKGISHGEVDFESAIAQSCNGAFAAMGESIDWEQFYALCESFGYNTSLPVKLLSNGSQFELNTAESLWEVLQTSIGQGRTQITPLHNAMIAAAVANDGVMMKPYVLDHVENADGATVKTFSSESWNQVMTAHEAKLLRNLMRQVVTDGTGSKAQGEGYQVAGKTGSAEWASGEDTHAWFIGFAGENSVEDADLVVSVLVEKGGSGGSAAAPIAKAVFDAFYN